MLAQQLLNGIVVSGVYALFALGFTLVFGIQRILNLAHGTIFMTGAMVAWYTVKGGGPLWLGFILAIVASGLLSVFVEIVLLAAGSHTTMSASAPTAMLPFCG